MSDPPIARRLAAILAADVVGYSRLMGVDEAGTLATLKSRRQHILAPLLTQFAGRLVKLMGDGMLLEFSSAVGAVQFALELQRDFAKANEGQPADRHIVLRIGINLGEIIIEGDDIYGDGVNIAARLEALAEPGGICVAGKVFNEVQGKTNAEFEALGPQQLKNIAQAVPAYAVSTPTRKDRKREASSSISPSSNRPSIAVLPFDNWSGNPAQQYISDGITEDITTELARFTSLSVAARHAAFHFGGRGRDPMQAARDLGVTYVLEGSVRVAGKRIRVTAQLIDARSGNHVWAEKYDRDNADIFDIQDEVVLSIAATLEGRMMSTEVAKAHARPTSGWSAYDFVLQGRELMNNYREPEAIPFFRQAISIDPQFAPAHAYLSMSLTLANLYSVDRPEIAEAEEASKRAMELAPSEASSHWARGTVLLWRGEHKRAQSHLERALNLNPVDIQIRGDYGEWQRLSGFTKEALATIENAMALGPFVPIWFGIIRGHILFDLGRYAEAIEALETLPPHYFMGQLYRAASFAYAGKPTKATAMISKVLEERPDLSITKVAGFTNYAKPERQQHFIEGIRKAGLPE